MCPRCQARGGQTWQGDPPQCAINDNGTFTVDNWNCATMIALRNEAITMAPAYANDQYAAIMPLTDGRFLVVGWYKNRGATEYVGVLDECKILDATLADIETAIETAINSG